MNVPSGNGLSAGTKEFYLVTLVFDLLSKNLTLAIYFEWYVHVLGL
jgi:hypothetical protein